jgi:hypothetical protein
MVPALTVVVPIIKSCVVSKTTPEMAWMIISAEREATNNIIGGSTNDVERRQALDSGVQHWEREDAGYLMREVHQ